ncbi:MAG TPA: hypothetical protein VFL12_00215 [Thermoanaerobaculia bacterium]|nr:hypothetical protein [Thermoanaerobaculia bacterium]
MNPAPAPESGLSVKTLADGSADRTLRLFAARGLLPLGIEDRLRTLLALGRDADPEISDEARRTLARVSPDEWGLLFDLVPLTGPEIEVLATATDDAAILEEIVRNPETPAPVLSTIAATAEGSVQEALVVNQRRLLAEPALLAALEGNPALTVDSRRLLREMREEFFEKVERRAQREAEEREAAAREEAERAAAETDAAAAQEAEAAASAAAPEPEEELTEERRMALHQRLAYMPVAQRIEVAMKGTREERRILITSVLKPVWEAVLKSPFLSDIELEAFASMRNVEEEVYRRMAAKPDWVRKYPVALALVRNAKVPPEIGMGLVKFLRIRDLKSVMNDRNLPEAVRVTARKLYLIKRQ